MACDICGKTGTPLADLLESYQTDDIKAICPECESIVNKKRGKLQSMVFNMLAVLLKRFMVEKRAKHQGESSNAS